MNQLIQYYSIIILHNSSRNIFAVENTCSIYQKKINETDTIQMWYVTKFFN